MSSTVFSASESSDGAHFHSCPVAGCGATIRCEEQSVAECERRVIEAVAAEDAFTNPPRGAHAPELLARNGGAKCQSAT